MDYENDVMIDETALDVEWLEQPNLMLKYGKLAAETRRDADQAKENLELVRAELDKKIRTDPSSYGIEKATETAVQNMILVQPEYKEASEAYIETKYEMDVARYVVSAVDSKKTALENLVKLFGMQYFAGPKVPRDLHKEWKIHEKQREKELASKITIRRRDKK